MKITKTKEVVTECIDILPGTYYFEDETTVAHKFTIEDNDIDYPDYIMETLYSSLNNFGIRVIEDSAWESDNLPYSFRQFILGISGKKIEKEEYYKERREIIEKLKNE